MIFLRRQLPLVITFVTGVLFTAQYYVSTSAAPSAAGSVILSPPGGWYSAGTQVTANVAVNSGWAFASLSGSLAGPIAPQALTVSAPANINANFIPDFTLTSTSPAPTSSG